MHNRAKHNRPVQLSARTIHGVEWVAAAEIEGRLGADVTALNHREIRFRVGELERSLLELGSVDDVFLTCGVLGGLDHTRASLAALAEGASAIDFQRLVGSLRRLRSVTKRPRFDVVASFLGRRNYNRFEIEDHLGGAIAAQTGWHYLTRSFGDKPVSEITFRAHLSNDEAYVGLRLSPTPLHRRPYKTATQAGTLHPPLAYVMAMLAGLKEGLTTLDPCCGVGTIPIEVARLQPAARSVGTDLDPEAISKAVANAGADSKEVTFLSADAGRLPFADASFDRVISNPPWGRTVEARGTLAGRAEMLGVEISRVLRPGGRVVLLLDPAGDEDAALERAGLRFVHRMPVSLFGSWPQVWVLTGEDTDGASPVDAEADFGPELSKYFRRRPADSKQAGDAA